MIIHFVTVYLQTWRCETTYKDRTGILPSPPGRTDLSYVFNSWSRTKVTLLISVKSSEKL